MSREINAPLRLECLTELIESTIPMSTSWQYLLLEKPFCDTFVILSMTLRSLVAITLDIIL
jgi:hypothetical protein